MRVKRGALRVRVRKANGKGHHYQRRPTDWFASCLCCVLCSRVELEHEVAEERKLESGNKKTKYRRSPRTRTRSRRRKRSNPNNIGLKSEFAFNDTSRE